MSALSAAIAPARLSRDPEACAVMVEDIAGPAAIPALAVARPADAQGVAALVAAARADGLALAPRGGGMSYTAGFQAVDARPVVVVDLGDLDAVDIDPVARIARVGAGATWAALHEAASAHGLRAPFFGPLSGLVATVGGALSQNGAFFGSAAHGYAAQSAVGLQAADGTGRLIRLGAEAAGAHPALPWLGPGLLQSFLGDNGALGIKTEALIRLLPMPPAPRFASYAFDDAASIARAQAALADIPHLAEVWAFDREAHEGLARTGFSVLETAAMAGEVAGGAGGLFSAARRLAEAAVIRRAVLTELAWSLHMVIEPPLASLADPVAEAAQDVVLAAGGRAIPDAVPRATRARPFRALKALIGPEGERWLPCHGVVPAAEAADALAEVEAWKVRRAPDLSAHGIRVSLLLASVGAEIIVEPQLHWPDALSAHQRAFGTPRQVQANDARPARPEARAVAAGMRAELIELFRRRGAGRLQIGRRYAYAEDLAPETLSVLQALKQALDPDRVLNPGVLGL